MRLVWAIALGWLALAAPPVLAQDDSLPLACRPQPGRGVDYLRCANAVEPGSAAHRWALINLASQAVQANDFPTAVRRYDEAAAGGQSLISDPLFHAYRGTAFAHVGRDEEALADARLALSMLDGSYAWQHPGMAENAAGVDRETVLLLILPILHEAEDPGAASALAMLEAMPINDWVSSVNRAGMAVTIGRPEEALRMNAVALAQRPPHPAALNNQCMILTALNRAAEGVGYCERAVAAAPQIGAVHDSLADALVALGRCEEAEAALQNARRLDPSSAHYQRTLTCSSTE